MTRLVSMMVLTIAVLSALAATTVCFAADVDSNVIAEFCIDNYSAIPLVPVRHKGSEYVFVLDTGSANTSFLPGLFHLLTKTPRKAITIDGDRSTFVAVYRSPELHLGDITIPPLSSITCLGADFFKTIPKEVHGQLGMDAMRNLLIRIDFDRAKISFLRKLPADAGVRLALDKELWHGLPMVRGNIEGIEQSFVLDTGCFTYGAGRMVKRTFDEMIGQHKLAVVDIIQSWSGNDIQPHRAGVLMAPLSVAGHRHAGLVFAEIPNADWTVNVLGIGYLRRYITTFDFQHRAIYPTFRRSSGEFPAGFRGVASDPRPGTRPARQLGATIVA